MQSSTSPETVLSRIAELARQASAQPDVPTAMKSLLSDILELATHRERDTPEPSDVPQTENQSL